MRDEKRLETTHASHGDILLDYSRERVTEETLDDLVELAEEVGVRQKAEDMFHGKHLNVSEDRAVLHAALRAHKGDDVHHGGEDVIDEVHGVLSDIEDFSNKVREGEIKGHTGKELTDVVSIGIGGSYLGPLFVHTALETLHETQVAAEGRTLSFLANIDPEDVARALAGKDPERTLVLVISKTFTTAETMLNAKTVRRWLTDRLGEDSVKDHMVAISSNKALVSDFGIARSFGFWDWVGGRYSVSSAVGVLPLSLQYGFSTVRKFLDGLRDSDFHFRNASVRENIPILMALMAVWNVTFLGSETTAVLPYAQSLSQLSAHIQQLSMESNGKGVDIAGNTLGFDSGEVIFGEPGTNGQHSFYQLIHQGRVVPCEFIAVAKGQQTVYLEDEPVSNHDELMSNFFAQPDALAFGQSADEMQAKGVDPSLLPHRAFSGNRPSLSLLLPSLGAFQIGQLLGIYEHKVATQGFLWDINSFDQFGVELGKTLASGFRGALSQVRKEGLSYEQVEEKERMNKSTRRIFERYLHSLEAQRGLLYREAFAQGAFEGFCTNGEECAVFYDDEEEEE